MYNKHDIIKLVDGRLVKIINLPSGFMSNGYYEVIEWFNNKIGVVGKSFWVEPSEILYPIEKEYFDDINKYFDVMWNKKGLNLIPKGFSSINIESEKEDFNKIELSYGQDKKHTHVNIYIGDKPINDKKGLTIRHKKQDKTSKFKKIINILTNK
jgi:hypothetical protein